MDSKLTRIVTQRTAGISNGDVWMCFLGMMVSHGSFKLKERGEFDKDYAATIRQFPFVSSLILSWRGIIRVAAL